MPDSARTTTPFSLDAYLERIGWEGGRRPDTATLRGVQLAHMRAIPFENLDALGGRAPSLDLSDLMAKLVHGRRRGEDEGREQGEHQRCLQCRPAPVDAAALEATGDQLARAERLLAAGHQYRLRTRRTNASDTRFRAKVIRKSRKPRK